MKTHYIEMMASCIFSAALLASCTRTDINQDTETDGPPVTADLGKTVLTDIEGKMIDRERLADLNIYLFDEDGNLMTHRYCISQEKIEVQAYRNRKYHVFAIANAGRSIAVPYMDELLETSHSIDGEMEDMALLPVMSGRTEKAVTLDDDIPVSIMMERCFCMLKVNLDKENLDEGVEIVFDSVAVRNIPKHVPYFREGKASGKEDVLQEGYCISDHASINGTDGCSFFTFENVQGRLLPGNKDQKTKFFPEGDPAAGLCTCIEIHGKYSSPEKNGKITYRFYPGENDHDDFSIKRNRIYSMNVVFKGKGIDETTWRIDTSGMTSLVTEIRMDPERMHLGSRNLSGKIEATALPLYADNRKLAWKSSDSNICTVDDEGNVRGISTGRCTVTAESTDGSGICGSTEVSVDTHVYVDNVTFIGKSNMYTGEETSVTPVFQPADADNCGFTVLKDDSGTVSLSQVGKSIKVKALKAGETYLKIKADDNGKTYSFPITVKDRFLNAPESITLAIGEKIMIPYEAGPETVPVFRKPVIDYIIDFSHDGWITGRSEGKTMVTVTAHGITREIIINVRKQKLTLNTSSEDITMMGFVKLRITEASPAFDTYEWTCRNESIADIDEIPGNPHEVNVFGLYSIGSTTVSVTGRRGDFSMTASAVINVVYSEIKDIDLMFLEGEDRNRITDYSTTTHTESYNEYRIIPRPDGYCDPEPEIEWSIIDYDTQIPAVRKVRNATGRGNIVRVEPGDYSNLASRALRGPVLIKAEIIDIYGYHMKTFPVRLYQHALIRPRWTGDNLFDVNFIMMYGESFHGVLHHSMEKRGFVFDGQDGDTFNMTKGLRMRNRSTGEYYPRTYEEAREFIKGITIENRYDDTMHLDLEMSETLLD